MIFVENSFEIHKYDIDRIVSRPATIVVRGVNSFVAMLCHMTIKHYVIIGSGSGL